MKKIVTVFLAFIMLMSMSVSVFAEVGGFVESPSNNQAPVLIEGENEADDCVAVLMITAYADRDELPTSIREKMEQAYEIIRENPNLSTLNKKVEQIAKDLNVEVADLAVSDLFDISTTNCDAHIDHGHFDIVLEADTLKNFVCLLHYYNGEWRVVEDAKVTQNGEHLEFTEDEFSPFAIVVDTGEAADASQGNGIWVIFTALSLLLVLLIIFIAAKRKKKEE